MPPPRPLAPPRGMTLGQWYHTLKGLDVGKCHTKFQLSSPENIKVISCKRNADVNLHLNLQVNLNLVTNMTYASTHVTSRQNAICPTPAKAGGGIKIKSFCVKKCLTAAHSIYTFIIFLLRQLFDAGHKNIIIAQELIK